VSQRGRTEIAPLRFRRRLAIAFGVIAGLAAGMLAIGTYFLVASQRVAIFERRAHAQAELAVGLAREGELNVPAESLDELIGDSSGFQLLIVGGQTSEYSTANFHADQVPAVIRDVDTEMRGASTTVDGESYYVVGSQIRVDSPARMYFWFSKELVHSTTTQLRNVLLIGWAVVSTLSLAAGRSIAIRTLTPIQLAAEAARHRAEGLLHTRLDDTKSDEFRAWSEYFDDVAEALESKLQELQAAHERERRFTADVAHDLRTPLGAMVSASSILAEYLDEMPIGARRPTELIINDVGRLRRLVTDLLEIGRLDAQKEAPRIEPIDVAALLHGVVMSVRRDVEVPIRTAGEQRVYSDRVRLERALANIIENAFVHGGESVAISASANDDRLVIEVSDQGPGISEDQLPHIFDRFHKAEASRTAPGSGLGLAIASQHVASLGGTLTAENAEGGGARFRIDVPAGIPDGEE
jgi:signal transduction histidine kinase